MGVLIALGDFSRRLNHCVEQLRCGVWPHGGAVYLFKASSKTSPSGPLILGPRGCVQSRPPALMLSAFPP